MISAVKETVNKIELHYFFAETEIALKSQELKTLNGGYKDETTTSLKASVGP